MSKQAIIEALRSVLSPERALDVFEHRKALRKPLTVRAAQLLAKEFGKLAVPDQGADWMILRGYQGFQADWMIPRKKRQQPASPLDAFDAAVEEMDQRNGRRQYQAH